MTPTDGLPDRLKTARVAAELSQSQLAERLCVITGIRTVTRHDVSRWERGTRRPTAWLPALATALGVALSTLLACETPAPAGPDEDEWERMNDLLRRTFLRRGLAAIALPAVGLDELRHIAAALEDARRYADHSVVEYFRRRLDECAAQDRATGPGDALPKVLGLIAAIEQTALDAKPPIRTELLRTAARAAELAGWFYRDLAVREHADYWRDRAMEWAQAAADPAMQGYVLLKKSQAAWDERDGLRMLTLAEAVQNGPWTLPARVQAEAAQQTARGHAMVGQNAKAVVNELHRARDLLARDTDPGSPIKLSPHYNEALFELQIANCLVLLDQPDKALDIYERRLTRATFAPRDFGYFLSSKAAAQADAGDIDAAAQTSIEALTIARETSSARTHASILRVAGQLRPYWTTPAVRALRAALLS